MMEIQPLPVPDLTEEDAALVAYFLECGELRVRRYYVTREELAEMYGEDDVV